MMNKKRNKFAAKLPAILIFSLLLIPFCSYADDTAALQAKLNAGNVVLTAGAKYTVTGLSVSHALNMNGATITMTGASNACIKLTAAGASVTNGTVTGTWSNTTAGNAYGALGVRILADNCAITNMVVTAVPAYGILVGPYNKPVITGCTISNTGYIGVYYDSEANTTGGTFSNNTIDRSMLPATTIQQGAVMIRASTATTNFVTTGWTITNNIFKMPYAPSNSANECMEIRWIANSTVSGNTFTNGSIGCSVVRGTNVTVTGNKFDGQSLEGIEFADCTTSNTTADVITRGLGVGILMDGSIGCTGTLIKNDQISGTTSDCIHAYLNTQQVTVTGCTLVAGKGARGMNLQKTTGVSITNTTFNGNSAGTLAVLLDTCPGDLTINGGAISNFTSCVVSIYSATSGLINNVTMSNVKVTNVPKALQTTLSNGATLGSNVVVVNH